MLLSTIYRDWTGRQLYSSLDWQNKLWDHTSFKAGKTLEAVGIATSAYAG